MCFGRLLGNIFLQRSFKIKTGAGEGAAYADFFQKFQSVQVDFLHNVEVFDVLACFGVADNTDIKTAAVIGKEMNAYIFFVNKREIFQIIFQLEDKFLDLGSRCAVGQAKRKVDAAAFAQRVVGNRPILKGLSSRIIILPKTLAKASLAANATAKEPILREAMKALMS